MVKTSLDISEKVDKDVVRVVLLVERGLKEELDI